MPYSSRPEASAPSTKYFIADSVAGTESRCSAISEYSASDSSSRPMYRVRKWDADTIRFMPNSANSDSEKYSPLNRPRSAVYWRLYTSTMAVTPYIASLTSAASGSATNMPEKVVTGYGVKVHTCAAAAPTRVSSVRP